MITKFNKFILESVKYPTVVYHGSFTTKHDFSTKGKEQNGTFFSTEDWFAYEYTGKDREYEGGALYKVTLKPNLNLFETKNLKNCKLLFDKFGEFEDDAELYLGDDDDYVIHTPEQLYNLAKNGENWVAIEFKEGCVQWLSEHYDGVIIYENMVQNILIFDPVKDKIESFEEED
jgi:hypothetical protein